MQVDGSSSFATGNFGASLHPAMIDETNATSPTFCTSLITQPCRETDEKWQERTIGWRSNVTDADGSRSAPPHGCGNFAHCVRVLLNLHLAGVTNNRLENVGLKVFAATRARERELLGDSITESDPAPSRVRGLRQDRDAVVRREVPLSGDHRVLSPEKQLVVRSRIAIGLATGRRALDRRATMNPSATSRTLRGRPHRFQTA